MTRGLMIAAPRSGSGKTTLTLGLLRALDGPDERRRRQVGSRLHRSGVSCGGERRAERQPGFLGNAARIVETLAGEAARGRELLLCEASMGLFDGVPGETGRTCASADVAAALGLPVLLMIDVSGQAQSAAAVVKAA